jgi:hypothetical protein
MRMKASLVLAKTVKSCVVTRTNSSKIILVDISFFTLSNSPIQKLKIDYSYLYPKSGQYLTSIFSSLTTLEITANTNRFLAIVRDPPLLLLFIPNRIAIEPQQLH